MTEHRITYIYLICDPETGEVRYVGRAYDIDERRRQHMSSPLNPPLREWLRGLKESGSEAVFKMHSEYRWWGEAEDAERLLIAGMAKSGARLFNRYFALTRDERWDVRLLRREKREKGKLSQRKQSRLDSLLRRGDKLTIINRKDA